MTRELACLKSELAQALRRVQDLESQNATIKAVVTAVKSENSRLKDKLRHCTAKAERVDKLEVEVAMLTSSLERSETLRRQQKSYVAAAGERLKEAAVVAEGVVHDHSLLRR